MAFSRRFSAAADAKPTRPSRSPTPTTLAKLDFGIQTAPALTPGALRPESRTDQGWRSAPNRPFGCEATSPRRIARSRRVEPSSLESRMRSVLAALSQAGDMIHHAGKGEGLTGGAAGASPMLGSDAGGLWGLTQRASRRARRPASAFSHARTPPMHLLPRSPSSAWRFLAAAHPRVTARVVGPFRSSSLPGTFMGPHGGQPGGGVARGRWISSRECL